jgi:hypothetical protein
VEEVEEDSGKSGLPEAKYDSISNASQDSHQPMLLLARNARSSGADWMVKEAKALSRLPSPE